MSGRTSWIVWLAGSTLVSGYLALGLVVEPKVASHTFLPGKTTHGHYQIELACHECHTPAMGVQNDACVRCHGEEMKEVGDTHAKKKFSDPAKAHLLEVIDARSCVTCHKEHVPEQTLSMGLTLPTDYCWHCHQDVAEQRPSHANLPYDSCNTAGCHNFHDNRALYENYLAKHFGEPDVLDQPQTRLRNLRNFWIAKQLEEITPLSAKDQDAPPELKINRKLLSEWEGTAHAQAGVNCMACHRTGEKDSKVSIDDWSDDVAWQACKECHAQETETFLEGRHGMRLAADLPAMQPKYARLPMHHESLHRKLDCTACHGAHQFDTAYAAVEACLKCHSDEHSLAYKQSSHFQLWQDEMSGNGAAGSGVSCATCHMPRQEGDEHVVVQHNQNANLRPNEKMVRSTCTQCHGLQFTLDALADDKLRQKNYSDRPAVHVQSLEMTKAWFDMREKRKQANRRKQKARSANNQSTSLESTE